MVVLITVNSVMLRHGFACLLLTIGLAAFRNSSDDARPGFALRADAVGIRYLRCQSRYRLIPTYPFTFLLSFYSFTHFGTAMPFAFGALPMYPHAFTCV